MARRGAKQSDVVTTATPRHASHASPRPEPRPARRTQLSRLGVAWRGVAWRGVAWYGGPIDILGGGMNEANGEACDVAPVRIPFTRRRDTLRA